MGKLALAAKITHVPSMYLSEIPGKNFGCRQAAIDGHKEIGARCREMGVDTIVVFDTHWLVNSAYHINCSAHFSGVYTSNELPHFIRDMTYDYDGNPALGQLIADEACKRGVRASGVPQAAPPAVRGPNVRGPCATQKHRAGRVGRAGCATGPPSFERRSRT